ncbi:MULTISPECIES: hypothetical protein [unclassified Oleiphilus]|jgi:siroheme synthase (precorrin-2 oxidase/ferrochelatase)|uniref:hypothetical protein n=1 Tax=unclassified Oleiphilus TaxID=2631174 RepID=UPI0007C314B1|nr:MULTISPECIES: hypothetical protein [unclassified Oleiphilus]KZY44899.1 hypothetical protein A3732_11505 [Oleiphilus sp. HI0050]KZY75091.1 hypothetical protein A3740_16010 [Oleiphilus sp. HI0068]KZY78646.1 hypothetical protein A3741_21360 [Oleiphilus sp. HI0069]KZY85432.1 hypothetical protein A3743_19125 [Oleiphilus sp. HI0072]KZZ14198.1 hypothetical protein A3749_05420 [Oleiphilus sp. HI0078]KZZ21099.1 hypothetical protein A3752_09835 [Oleiphilus sp. HI0081]
MNTYIPIILIIVIAVLIFKSMSKPDPAAEQCAKDIIQLLKKNQGASAEEIAKVLKAHNRTVEDAEKVTVIVKTRLVQAHIRKEDHNDVMLRVRQAKQLLATP